MFRYWIEYRGVRWEASRIGVLSRTLEAAVGGHGATTSLENGPLFDMQSSELIRQINKRGAAGLHPELELLRRYLSPSGEP